MINFVKKWKKGVLTIVLTVIASFTSLKVFLYLTF